MIPIHNNLLYSSGSLPSFSGGTQATFLFREGSSNPTIDLGINWTVVYNTYGGIEIEIEAQDYFNNNNLILGTYNNSFPYDFNYSTPYVEAGWSYFTFKAGGFQNKLEVSTSQHSTKVTAILDYYSLSASVIRKSFKVIDSYQGTIGEPSVNVNLGAPLPVNLDGRNSLKIFFPGGLHANDSGGTFAYKKIKVYGYDGTNKTLIFEGVPWNDENGQACLKDLVSYKTFYSEIPNKLITE